jgi:hypothetical protein
MPAAKPKPLHEQLTDRALLDSLASTTCPACSGKKNRHQTFCRRDYHRLSMGMKQALYNRLGAGYYEAVLAACHYLGVTTWHLPREPLASERISLNP